MGKFSQSNKCWVSTEVLVKEEGALYLLISAGGRSNLSPAQKKKKNSHSAKDIDKVSWIWINISVYSAVRVHKTKNNHVSISNKTENKEHTAD